MSLHSILSKHTSSILYPRRTCTRFVYKNDEGHSPHDRRLHVRCTKATLLPGKRQSFQPFQNIIRQSETYCPLYSKLVVDQVPNLKLPHYYEKMERLYLGSVTIRAWPFCVKGGFSFGVVDLLVHSECDEPQYCSRGTDCSDCRNCGGH